MKVRENKIIKTEKGCVLQKNWKGTKEGIGRSYNYFILFDSTWNQLWLDSYGTILKLSGIAENQRMALWSEKVNR